MTKRRNKRPTSFSEAFDGVFAQWFKGPTWRPWRAVGKVIFGEPLTPEELELFREHTGRTVAPTAPAREIWLACGRRAGKDWFSAAVVVYIACYMRHELKVGDLGRVMLLAVDQDQAAEGYRYICELIDSIPELAERVVSRSTKQGLLRLDLDNRIQILVKPADKRRVRGRTVLAVVASEIAFWWDDEQSANPATEVLRALRPSMLGVKNALMLAVSSPYARKGAMYESYQKHWGKDGDRVVFWKAPTQAMRPDRTEDFLAFLESERELDPVSYESEYLANFRKDLEDYVSVEQVQAVTAVGRERLDREDGATYYAFADPAGGGGQDSATLCVARRKPGQRAAVALVREWRPPFSAVDVAAEMDALIATYGLRHVRGDKFSGDTWADILRKRGVSYVSEDRSKSDLFHDLIPLINGQLIELLDPTTGSAQDRAVKQLLALERQTSRQGRDSISHPRGAHDDVINSVAGALLLAATKASFVLPVAASSLRPQPGKVPGTRYVGNDSVEVNGERYRDARGVESTAPPAATVRHDPDSDQHRSTCRACRRQLLQAAPASR